MGIKQYPLWPNDGQMPKDELMVNMLEGSGLLAADHDWTVSPPVPR
jgi:hypothetical protein